MNQQSLESNVYAFDGRMLVIVAITTVFLIVLLLAGLHLYARWWLRREADAQRTHVMVLAGNHTLSSDADHGLEPAVLNSLPVFTYSSKAKAPMLECAVCLSEFADDEMVRLLPKCNHAFHIECIDMWFHSHSTCPLCRSPVEPAVNLAEPSPVVLEEVAAEDVSGMEPGSSSGCSLCAKCRNEERSANANVSGGNTVSVSRRGKAMDVKIDVGPARRIEFDDELSESSPISRLLSFRDCSAWV